VPIDVVKADRFIDENPDLSDQDRADQAAQQDWDESVQVLAGGFPTIIDDMAEEIDWTENLGEAMLAQTDDLLDAVQRMRAQAEAAGNLASNEAQVVETEGDTISIAPADPEIVYVPSYDPVAAYAPLAPGTTYAAPAGVNAGNLITTGAIAFGSALLIDEIFDDDDDWDDYWRGPTHIDWDDDAIYPRRGGINAGGDVNIDVDRNRVRVNDRDRQIGNDIRIGDRDRPIDRDAAWKPDARQKDAARQKLADRQAARGTPGAAQQKLKASGGGGDDARARLQSAKADRSARPAAKAPPRTSALKPGGTSGHKAAAAKTRGAQSLQSNRSPTAQKARASGAGHAKAVSRPKPKAAKAPQRKAAAKQSSFKRPPGGAKKAHAASSRGGKHKAKAQRRR
jgi:hypothetical protein